MKTLQFLLCATLIGVGASATLAATIPAPYELATWRGFSASAVSYTFDDNSPKQFSVAQPMFDEKGLQATFFCIVGNPDWAVIESASAQGHEIGSHTLTHPDLTTLTDTEVVTEESGAKDLIETHTGKPCVSIAYPFCTVPNESITSQYYSFARSCNGSLVPSTPSDFLSIGSLGADGDMDVASDNAASSGKWLVWLIHGIDDDAACCPILSSKLQSNLDYVAANTDNWWVETFGNVSRYIQERDAAVLTVISSGTTNMTLQLTDSLDDAIFNYPLTLRRAMPSGWLAASVTQNGTVIPSQVVNGKLMFDVVPNGGDIVLSKQEVPLALVASTNLSSYGDSVTFNASVLTNGVTASNATGTVIFQDGGSAIGTNAVNGGQATLVISNFSVGAHSITAAYSGDAYYSSNASGTLAHEVVPRAVVLSGSKVYDGATTISAADLAIANLVSGDNVTLSGAGTLDSKNVGSQAIAALPDTSLTPALVDWAWAGQNYWGLYAWFNTPPNFGNAMICVVSTRDNVGSGFVDYVSFPDASNFTRIAQAVNANGVTTEIWYNPSVYSSNNQLTVKLNNPNISAVCIVAQYTNLALAGALDQTASATGTGATTVTGTTPTTTQSAELWIVGIGHANTDSLSGILDGFTELSGQSSSHPATTAADQVTLHFLQKVVTSTGEAGSGGTIGTSREWAGAIATFKAAAEQGGLLLGGPDAGNYTLSGASGEALVTAKPLNYTGIAAESRVYDGTTNATFTSTAAALAPEDVGTGTASDGKPYTGDAVNFVTGALTGSFADKNVGTAKPVTLSGGLSLSGAQAINYSVGSSSAALTANITGAVSSLELGSSQNPSDEGASVTFTTTVSSVDTPTGEVVFSANGAAFSTNALASGVASAVYGLLPPGTNSITAQFAAQGNYQASSNSLLQVVRAALTRVILSYSLDGSHLNLSWLGGGVLLEAPTLFGPWTTNTIDTNFVSIILTNDTIFFKAIMP